MGMSGIPTATVKMCGPDHVKRYVAATGTGPVDAVYKAIDQIVGVSVELETYQLSSITEGIEVCIEHICSFQCRLYEFALLNSDTCLF